MNTTNKLEGRFALAFLALLLIGLCSLIARGQTAAVKQKPKSLHPPPQTISGTNLRTFLAAYELFQKQRNVPGYQKQVENYNVEISETNQEYEVAFYLKYIPSENNAFGGGLIYTVDKSNYHAVFKMGLPNAKF